MQVWRAIAIILEMVNGEPSGDPTHLQNGITFESKEQCETWRGSQVHTDALENLNAVLKEQFPGQTFRVTTECQQDR